MVEEAVLRQNLVEGLKKEGVISSSSVEAAFRAIPRHLFLPNVPMEEAYTNRAIVHKQIEGKWVSSSSQPSIMAIMLEQLDLRPGHKVLEIGAGTGYNASLMAHIVGETGQIVTIDIDEDIVQFAREHIGAAGYSNVKAITADGGFGFPEDALYDRIILSVSSPDITPAWWEQLIIGGRLVMPLQIVLSQGSVAFEKHSAFFDSLSVVPCGFMSLRGAFAASPLQEVPLRNDPGLTLQLPVGLTVNEKEVYSWLGMSAAYYSSGVEIFPGEFFDSLSLWLELNEPRIGILHLSGQAVDGNLIPPFLGFSGQPPTAFTPILYTHTGLAALTLPPGEARHVEDINAGFASRRNPFKLFVCSYGPQTDAVQPLLDAIRSWQASGRPTASRLHIHAYPKTTPEPPVPAAIMIERAGTWLAMDWQQADPPR